nr:unnamed protein product [Callosobruchus analis]
MLTSLLQISSNYHQWNIN